MNYKLTKRACYFSYVGASSVFSLPPLLFVTFHQMYGISYTLLGTLVLINFCSQLIIDLIFTFFSKHFNIKKTISIMPLLTTLGLLIYALVPTFFPGFAYLGLALGTVVFSVASGLGEVLLSPIIAAIPSENSERDMSFLHSLYAYGVVMVVIVSSVYFKLFSTTNWLYLTLFFAVLPIIPAILFSVAPVPPMQFGEITKTNKKTGRGIGLAFCTACIFLGGAVENSMTNWISSYIESALQIPKMVGDILGLCLFAVLLGLGRSFYAKKGKNIAKVLLFGMAGSFLCYIVAGVCTVPVVSMVACVLVGMCASMLWPGTLIFMEEKMPGVGVAAYALMAAGGDFGSSVAPQLVGVVIDKVTAGGIAAKLSATLNLSAEQIGLKAGMLVASLFALLGIILIICMLKYFKKKEIA